MPYSNAIPQPGDLLSQSRADLLENFAQIQTWIAINHGIFAAADEGKHKHVSFPEQGADPATAVNEMALYTKVSGGISALFLRNENNGDVRDLTSKAIAGAAGTFSGTTLLPSGIRLCYGQGTFTAGVRDSAIVFSSGGFGATCYSVTGSAASLGTGDHKDYVFGCVAITAAGFTARRVEAAYVGTGLTFSYLAIGI